MFGMNQPAFRRKSSHFFYLLLFCPPVWTDVRGVHLCAPLRGGHSAPPFLDFAGGLLSSPQKDSPIELEGKLAICTSLRARGCRGDFSPATNTARAEGRGIKGGDTLFAGGPGTRRSLVSLCLLSSHKKVGRGGGAERPDGSRSQVQQLASGAAGPAAKKPPRPRRWAKTSSFQKEKQRKILRWCGYLCYNRICMQGSCKKEAVFAWKRESR